MHESIHVSCHIKPISIQLHSEMRFLVRNGETGSVVQVDIDGSQTVYDLMRASGGSLGIPASESGRLRASMELDMATPLARLPQGAGTIVLEKVRRGVLGTCSHIIGMRAFQVYVL